MTVIGSMAVAEDVAPRPEPRAAVSGPGDGRVAVVVCRGCCCGNARRDAGTDHAGQLARLERFARGEHVLVRATDCLGPCEQANVVVVRPSAAGRRVGGRPVWLGLVNRHAALDLLEGWVRSGGPGRAELPAALDTHVIARPNPRGGDRGLR